jgi:restriction endonuclease S subunit
MTLTGDPPDVGKVQLIFNPPKDKLSWNQRVALLRLKKQDYISLPEFLFVTLSSKYCRDHIERWAKGIRQRNVGNPAVLSMAIPVLSQMQETLTKLVTKSFNLLEKSKDYYRASEQLLLSDLGLLDWKPKHELAFVKNFSDTQNAERTDAEYFQPKYEEIVNAVKKYKGGFDELGNFVKIKDRNFTPDEKVQYKYIELANISSNGEITGYTENFGNELPSRARRKVQKEDVIVSSIEGSLESIALITEDWKNALCSTGFFAIQSEKINSETLLVLLKMKVGQLQLKKGCKGTILTAIGKDELSKIILPKVGLKIQEEIKEKIAEMYSAKKLSKILLDIAKQGVEMAIEKDEKIAENWIKDKLSDENIKL